MQTLLIILIVAVAGWFLIMLGLKGMAFLLRRGTLRDAEKSLAGERILKITNNASFLGADFPGPNLPPRTSGVLAITDRQIYFLPWFPRKSISLPFKWVKGTKLQASYGEVATSIPNLVIRVRDLKDPEGSIAWLVHEPRDWMEIINSQLGSEDKG
ncbi:MAG: hypothetical protein JSV26_04320 [bacterium]|nr:MAG: hypothetical protein JSV26_04320 [bacterium]